MWTSGGSMWTSGGNMLTKWRATCGQVEGIMLTSRGLQMDKLRVTCGEVEISPTISRVVAGKMWTSGGQHVDKWRSRPQ